MPHRGAAEDLPPPPTPAAPYTERVLLQGLFIPLTVPFYRDGTSYIRKLEHNVVRYSLGPAAGLVALPPMGESGALSDAEATESLKIVGEAAGKTKVLLAGVERNSLHTALQMVDTAASADFDAVVLAPPPDWARFVHGSDARELRLFYQAVADRSALPVVLWSDAQPPSLQLPESFVAELAQHPNVIGLLDRDLTRTRLASLRELTAEVKREVVVTTIFEAVTRRMLRPEAPSPSSGGLVTLESLRAGTAVAGATVVQASPTLKTRTRSVGFQVLSAAAVHGIVGVLDAGAAGAMPLLAAPAPQACFEAYAAWKDGDKALAQERAGRLQPVEEMLEQLGPAGVKAACDFNGYFGGVPRLPRVATSAEERLALEAALAEIRN